MMVDVNQTYCGSHFPKYTNTESLCRTPKTNNVMPIVSQEIKKKPATDQYPS